MLQVTFSFIPMVIRKKLLPALLSVTLLGVFVWPDCLARSARKPAPSKRAEKGWVFDIRSDKGGHQLMYISSGGVRFKHKSFTAVLEAPEFDAVVFNSSTRKYTRMPYETWMKRYGSLGRRKFTQVGKPVKVAGFTTQRYRMPTRNPEFMKEFWMSRDLKFSPKISTFVSKVLNVPEDKGLPMKISSLRRGYSPIVDWEVVSHKREVFPKKLFAVPAGYQRVESEMELLIKDSDTEGMADLLR